MTSTKSVEVSPLRRRMIEDMCVRKFGEKTQHDYIRHIETFARFLGRSPVTATGEDTRQQGAEGLHRAKFSRLSGAAIDQGSGRNSPTCAPQQGASANPLKSG